MIILLQFLSWELLHQVFCFCLGNHKSFTVNTITLFCKSHLEDANVCTWSLHPPVVVGVNTDVFLLGAEGELTALQGFQLVVGLQVGPAPHSAVDDVGQALPVGHLQPPIQRPRNRHTLA